MVLVLLDGSLLFARPGITLNVFFVRTTTRLRHEEPRLGLLLSTLTTASLHNTMLLSQQLYHDKQSWVRPFAIFLGVCLTLSANLYVLMRYTRCRGLKMLYGMRDLDKQTAVSCFMVFFARNHNHFIDGLHRVWESYRLAGVPDDQRRICSVVIDLGFVILKTFSREPLSQRIKSKLHRLPPHLDNLDSLLQSLVSDYVHVVMYTENGPPQHARCWTPNSIFPPVQLIIT
ncbi:hypothetical protein K438DRAFT_1885389 [Mycena galopus ATCC 62051]|nr:hypothetical protein K438DRAFT_1885389 [Mycena galopus ATCC 62051]